MKSKPNALVSEPNIFDCRELNQEEISNKYFLLIGKTLFGIYKGNK